MSDPNQSGESSQAASTSAELPAPVIPEPSEAAKQLRCIICLTDPVAPRVCHKCAQIFCQACLISAYASSSRTCPHCRGAFGLESFVRMPWVEDHVKKLKSMTPRIADECSNHPAKLLLFFCDDCSKTACATCWTSDHTGHRVGPIESANESRRGRLSAEMFPRIADSNRKIAAFHAKQLYRHEVRYNHVKREGDRRVEELTRSIEEAWERECRVMASPIAKVEDGLRSVKTAAILLKDAAKDERLNRLVDNFRDLKTRVGSSEVDAAVAEETIDNFVPFRKEALQMLSPWLPGWDFKERIVIKDIKRMLSMTTLPKCVARFKINDISWNVLVGNREQFNDDVQGWPSSFMIYANMEGRSELKNYELCIEPVDDDHDDNDEDDDDEDDEDEEYDDDEKDESGEFVVIANRRKDVMNNAREDLLNGCAIVCRSTFCEHESLFFSVEDPEAWLNDNGEFEFVFKVRPLSYKQKLLDQEIYYKRLLAERSATTEARTNVADRGDENKAPKSKTPKDKASKGKRRSDGEPEGCSSGAPKLKRDK